MAKAARPIIIDWRDFSRGMSSSAFTSDGGFSPEGGGFNLYSSPGVLKRLDSRALVYNNLNGNIIASTGAQNGAGRYFITSNNRLEYSSTSGTTLTDSKALTGTLVKGFSDIVQFGSSSDSNIFITTNTNIIMVTVSSGVPNVVDNTWWTGTKAKMAMVSGYAHVMLVYENALWIADANFIHKWDGTTATYQALILPYNQAITSLGVDPGSGKMLIGVSDAQNASGSISTTYRVLVWDGYSAKPLRSVPVDGMVTSIVNLGGTTFMCYNTRFGYWNGGGINFIRKLNITYDADFLIYKNRIALVGDKILICEGKRVLAYGEISPGRQKNFYYIMGYTSDTNNWNVDTDYINHVMPMSLGGGAADKGEYVGVQVTGVGSPVLSVVDLLGTTTCTENFTFVSNPYQFTNLTRVKEVVVEFDTTLVANATPVNVFVLDGVSSSAVNQNQRLTNTANENRSRLSVTTNNLEPVMYMKLKLTSNTQEYDTWGIIRVIIWVDEE